MNAPVTTEAKPMTLRDRIERAAPEFKKALPGHIPVDKFIRTVQTAISMSPDLDAVGTSPEGIKSLMIACTKAATDGLVIDGREAALVTFNSKVKDGSGKEIWVKQAQYIPMFQGLMKLVRNSGDIISLTAEIAYEKDAFSYNPATDDAPDHSPDWFGDRGKPVGAYAVCKLKDGSTVVEIMSKMQIMAIAAQSKNAQQYDPASGKNWGEWWRKTLIRRITKYLPKSSDKDAFLQAVERIDDTFDLEATNGGPTVPVDIATATTKKRGAGAAKLKDITPTPQQTQQQPDPQQEDETPHDPETGEILDGEIEGGDMQPGDDI